MGRQCAMLEREPCEFAGISGADEAAREVDGVGSAARWAFESRLSDAAKEVSLRQRLLLRMG